MLRTLRALAVAASIVLPAPSAGQTRLTLADAISMAQSQNLDARAAAAVEQQAASRLTQARSAYLPTVDVSETWQRGNQPVFVFGSLLAQRRFAESDFAIRSLNHPDAMANIRTALTVEQSVFAPTSGAQVRTASIGHEIAVTDRVRVAQDVTVTVSAAYGSVLVAEAVRGASAAAIERANADLELARHRREAGMATDADVLQLEVALARAQQQEIRARADVTITRARFNEAIGAPLDADFVLTEPPESASAPDPALAPSQGDTWFAQHPQVKLATLREQLAASAVDTTRAAFLPRVTLQAGWELNGNTWSSPASSWVVGATGHINLFRGFADRARVAEARQQQSQRAIERVKTERSVRLGVSVATARLEAAHAAEVVGRSATTQARESHRIVRDRYESGLADVSALLGAAEAVRQAEVSEAAARAEVSLASAELNRAMGTR